MSLGLQTGEGGSDPVLLKSGAQYFKNTDTQDHRCGAYDLRVAKSAERAARRGARFSLMCPPTHPQMEPRCESGLYFRVGAVPLVKSSIDIEPDRRRSL